jgi:hypothetical protein
VLTAKRDFAFRPVRTVLPAEACLRPAPGRRESTRPDSRQSATFISSALTESVNIVPAYHFSLLSTCPRVQARIAPAFCTQHAFNGLQKAQKPFSQVGFVIYERTVCLPKLASCLPAEGGQAGQGARNLLLSSRYLKLETYNYELFRASGGLNCSSTST